MAATPVVDVGAQVVNLGKTKEPALRAWADDAGRKFYKRYASVMVKTASGESIGIPVLAGDDVDEKAVAETAAELRHLLLEASVSNATLLRLAQHKVRVLVGASGSLKVWMKHPEVSRDFTTGLGGGAPWFPSTGIQANEVVMEELFHTIQYTAMTPRAVCMYSRAYRKAHTAGLYDTDHSGPEVDGEPVPTVQADEYLAMAMMRWFGHAGLEEYKVKGNEGKNGGRTGRERLQAEDPKAFCLLSQVYRADDSWSPRPEQAPWKTNPNRGLSLAGTERSCAPILQELGRGCPSESQEWPYMSQKFV